MSVALQITVLLLVIQESLTTNGSEAQSVCIDRQMCTMRYELQLDFADAFQLNCSFVNNCICWKGVEIAYYEHPPYIFHDKKRNEPIGLLQGMLNEAIHLCCFGCNRITYQKPINGLGDMFSSNLSHTDYTAIFPVLASTNVKEYFAGPFIGMISTPGVAYVAIFDEVTDSLAHMTDAISQTWQLLVLSILMSLNAGFIVWILDTRHNEIDFPRAFPQGPIEGGWWAFVSMTTVGYGDRCPRSIISRAFAVLWILFGIALSGMFTAALTSALTTAFTSTTIDLTKKKVGVLNITRYEQNIALREGAIPTEFANIQDMKAALKTKSVDGLLIDRNVLGYNWDYLKSGLRLSVNLKIKNSDTTYGMMFDTMSVSNQTKKTNKKWATFLSTFFDYNKDNQNIMLSAAKNNLNQKISQEPFMMQKTTNGFSNATYMLIFKFVGVTSCALILLGIFYEVIRRSLLKNKTFSCSTGGLKISDLSKSNNDTEMVNLEDKAEKLIRDLEKILTDMKAANQKKARGDSKV